MTSDAGTAETEETTTQRGAPPRLPVDGGAGGVAERVVQGAAVLAPLMLAACGGGGGGGDELPPGPPDLAVASSLPGSGGSEPAALPASMPATPGQDAAQSPVQGGMSARDASRLLTQATFGIRTPEEIVALQREGIEHWLWRQFNAPCVLHTSYLDQQKLRTEKGKANEEMSYEAIWRQWLFEEGQLRGRVAFALSQIMVISNIAPDIKPYAMSSYMDLLNHHAFGNYRDLLKAVTLHPAMGYYLNMLRSKKEDTKKGTHPNENYAREVLQLFSIGLVKLKIDGSPMLDAQNKPIPTYSEAVVKGFARAFSGWSFGGEGNASQDMFGKAKFEDDKNWVTSMLPFSSYHETGPKELLDGVVLPANQTPEKDLDDAIDNIFHHPNVGPFICRQLIQRLVTSNPTPAYIAAVAGVFNDNGSGVRGDLRAVVRAILVHAEARGGEEVLSRPNYGKLREPVIRLANMLRAFNAKTPSPSGRTDLHYLDSPEDSLGQSPLLAPSVFNFFSPNYRHAGPLAQAGLVAPEFQITTETSVVGYYNTMAHLFLWEGYGWGSESKLKLDFGPWEVWASQPDKLVERMDVLLCNLQMTTATRARLSTLIKSLPSASWAWRDRVKKAFILLAITPEFVIQK